MEKWKAFQGSLDPALQIAMAPVEARPQSLHCVFEDTFI
jgi:hypothetical protein